jgi:opacity protein-like surface antigen
MSRHVIAAAALALLAGALPAAAQSPAPAGPRSNTQGFMVGAHLSGTSLSFEGEDSETGGGAGLALGYGFSPRWMLIANLDLAKVDVGDPEIGGSYGLGHFDLGVRYSFANPARSYVPWLSASVGARTASGEVEDGADTFDVSLSGASFTGGAGVQFHFTPKVALDLGLLVSGGKFSTLKIDDTSLDIDDASNSTSARLNIGIKFFPQGPRGR